MPHGYRASRRCRGKLRRFRYVIEFDGQAGKEDVKAVFPAGKTLDVSVDRIAAVSAPIQLNTPVGLLQIGGMKHFNKITSHRAYAK